MNNTTTVRFFGLAFGGEAVGRETEGPHQGRIVFALGAAPGDLAQVGLTRSYKGHAFGELLRLIESGDHESPFCPMFGRCGGCVWQHVPLAVQHREKSGLVRRAFRGLFPQQHDLPVVFRGDRAYRSRVRLALRFGGPDSGCGFRGWATHDLVLVPDCPVATGALSQGIADLSKVIRSWTDVAATGTAVLMAGDRGIAASVRANLPSGVAPRLAETLAMQPGWVGVRVDDGRSVSEAGDPVVEWVSHNPDLPWTFAVDADGFAQANRQITDVLRSDLLAELSQVSLSDPAVLELFCGAGTFTLPLLSRFSSVVALEGSAKAVRRLIHNAHRAGFDHLRAAVVDLSNPTGLIPYLNLYPDIVVLDPPREGAQALMTALGQSKASAIVYISCDHTTAARDIRILAEHGYGMTTLKVYDMFPHTSHCESLAVLRKVG